MCVDYLPKRKDRSSKEALILRDEGEDAVANRLGLVSNLEHDILQGKIKEFFEKQKEIDRRAGGRPDWVNQIIKRR